MKWLSIAAATAGLALFFLALTLKTTSLRRLRFARVVNLAIIRRRVPRHLRARVYALLLVASLILIGFALGQSINADRTIFAIVAGFGLIILVVRLLGFFFTHVSLVIFDIEIDPGSKFSFAHLLRSPFILGGLAMVILGAALPTALDGVLRTQFDSYWQGQSAELDQWAKDALPRYWPRHLMVDEPTKREVRFLSEEQFFSGELQTANRIVIEGRAGNGKTWFLNKLRFDYRNQNRNTVIVFLDAKRNLRKDEEILDHISRAAFGRLAWAGLPVARKRLARSLIVIDGLDEAENRDQISQAITRLAQDTSLKRSTLLVATRPSFEHGLTREIGFIEAQLSPLDRKESDDEVISRAAKLKSLAAGDVDLDQLRRCCLGKLRTLTVARGRLEQRPPAELALFYSDTMPNWPRITSEQLGRLFQKFVEIYFSADFRDPIVSGRFERPFLSTFRDIDIVGELFLETITGEFMGSTKETMSAALIERFVTIRVLENYQSHSIPGDAKSQRNFATRVIEMLTAACSDYVRHTPEVTTFSFDRSQFAKNFDGITFDQVLVESELLSKSPGGRRLVFGNPELDKYFLARARERSYK